MTVDPSRLALKQWLLQERSRYADVKYDSDGDNRQRLKEAMRDEGYAPTWANFVDNYLKRVEVFGLDTPAGRQAMVKAIVTLMHCLETAIEVHGRMPKPGVPSGEIV